MQAPHREVLSAPGPTADKKPPYCPRHASGEAGHSEKVTLPAGTAKAFLKATASEPARENTLVSSVCLLPRTSCPRSLFLSPGDAQDSTVIINKLSTRYRSLTKGTLDSESEDRSFSPRADLDLTLRKPFNLAESRLTHLWRVVRKSYRLPKPVSLQQDGIMEMKALGDPCVPWKCT